jgi:biopolymer transport protein ExbD
MSGVCPNSGTTYGCEWSIGYLWRWTNWLGRLDVIVLVLMLAYVVVVVIHVSWRYHIARRERETDTDSPAFQRTRRKLAADLSVKVGNIKSIASIAPYLGLAGTCIGLLSVFRGFDMEKHAALVMLTTYAVASLITTATGLLVAVPAVWSYNYLRVRLDLLESEISRISQLKSQSFPVAEKLPLTARFSKLPFAVIAAPGLAIIVLVWMPFFSPREATGFSVELASAGSKSDLADRLIVLRISDAGKLFLNHDEQDWNSLAGRLSEIYGMRVHRTLYLLAGDEVPFQTVADAIDIVGNVSVPGRSNSLGITVRLITPRAVSAECLEPIATGSIQHASR